MIPYMIALVTDKATFEAASGLHCALTMIALGASFVALTRKACGPLP